MIAVLIVALFAVVAVGSVLTLADAAVRSRNAFRLLRGELAHAGDLRRVIVQFDDSRETGRFPALRPAAVSTARNQRRPARAPERLRAAA